MAGVVEEEPVDRLERGIIHDLADDDRADLGLGVLTWEGVCGLSDEFLVVVAGNVASEADSVYG